MIDVLITCSGRELYFQRLLHSILKNGGNLAQVRFLIVGNGVPPPRHLPLSYNQYHLPQKVSIGRVMEYVKSLVRGETLMKLDDDALLASSNFFPRVEELAKSNPDSIFSPFPVGLINNLGGPRGMGHKVEYAPGTDTFYTKRMVQHVGGFARVMPTSVLQQVRFEDAHNEDSNVSSFANAHGIEMFYLENGLIVEHQESTLGQHERYAEYFGERF